MADYIWFEGTPLPNLQNNKEILEEFLPEFVIRDENIIIESYPKSGTNWLIEIVCLIQNKGNPELIQSVPIWQRSPWIETKIGHQTLINNEGQQLISSHLPFHLFPKTFFSSKAKVSVQWLRNLDQMLIELIQL
ncbi:bile salt sulfotransferase 1-like [Cricetulus griseus]|uniref:bile salt sulfotransferase 1-like n=1 Tax=Cricetulus griseus TaxID=10029 RepID=UPI00022F70F1|nr:bile salt sulfotransferase 1-like [Cricetulus griseus]